MRHRVDRLVLVDAVGIKVSDRETPDILDVFNTSPAEVRRRSLARSRALGAATTTRWRTTRSSRTRATGTRSASTRWHPYMYNPQLRRWLGTIRVPTLVLWGASDGIVTPGYGRAYAAAHPRRAL